MNKTERMGLGVLLGVIWYLLISVLGILVFWAGLALLLLVLSKNPIGHLVIAINPRWLIPYRKMFGPPFSDDEKKMITKMKQEGLL